MATRTRRALRILGIGLALLALALGAFIAIGVRASDHPVQAAALGEPRSFSQLAAVIDQPGPIEATTLVGAEWQVDRSGLINLDHEQAKAAGLKDGLEPIQIFLHVLRHPNRGAYLIDTGVERALRDDPSKAAAQGLIAKAMHLELLQVKNDTATVIEREGGIAGVLLTHLHYDHISGMPDVPTGTPIFAGPGETSQRFFLNAFAKPTTERALAGHEPISEWQFEPDADGRFAGILDVFGDQSLFALWVPGHTAGSTAYVARTPTGPVLYVGDTSHTSWGWRHGVEPGAFTRDQALNRESLARLRRLADEHPNMQVRLGHQHLEAHTEEIAVTR